MKHKLVMIEWYKYKKLRYIVPTIILSLLLIWGNVLNTTDDITNDEIDDIETAPEGIFQWIDIIALIIAAGMIMYTVLHLTGQRGRGY